MSLLRRRTVLRRFFAALERIASNVGLIREAGKEFRLFSAEVGACLFCRVFAGMMAGMSCCFCGCYASWTAP